MKRKRLDRDRNTGGWGFEGYPYYQIRVNTKDFHGLACFIRLIDTSKPISNEGHICWDLPKAGETPVCGGNGMTWMQLIPDSKSHVITAKYLPNDSISLWYVDVIDGIEYDTDGVAIFIDKYLDVCFTPQGDVIIDDRDELDEAFRSGELSQEQYDAALRECDMVVAALCADAETIRKTEILCGKILSHVNDRIEKGEKPFVTKYDSFKQKI